MLRLKVQNMGGRMKAVKLFFLMASTILFLLTGCRYFDGVKGNGNYISENRNIEDFSEIDISGAFNLFVEVGEEPSLKINTDENLHELIRTDVRNGRLIIDQKRNLRSKEPIDIRVTTKDLRKIDGAGACDIIVNNVNNLDFELNLSGATELRISGSTDNFNVELSGASKLFASNFLANFVRVEASGASKAEVNSDKSLLVNASGASKVNYFGNPSEIDYNLSGASSINRK